MTEKVPTETTPLELFQAALRRSNRGRPPVWLMRQAGRYLPEYRAIKERHSFKEMAETPELAVEVSLQPHRLLDVDAIIVFNDILIPLEKMGAPLRYSDRGPVFDEPLRDSSGLERLRGFEAAADAAPLLESIRLLENELRGRKPVLGFAGAPFTLSSYLVEGRVGQGVDTLKRVLYEAPSFFHRLQERLADMTVAYLGAQIDAGATAVQLFDTWAGQLGLEEYRECVLPYHQRIFAGLRERNERGAGLLLYVREASHVVEEMAKSGADGLSVEWRVPLEEARRRAGTELTLQGNLDPSALFAAPDAVRRSTTAILENRRGDPAFIANLGHGVLQHTPVESVRAFVDTVKGWS